MQHLPAPRLQAASFLVPTQSVGTRGIVTRLFAVSLLVLGGNFGVGREPEPPATSAIESIQPQGMLVRECTLEGETRKDGVVPRHANAIQLSRQRWLVVYSTHGYRGVDDERSIVYQIRRDASDGAVLKEGFLVRTLNDWKPDGVPAAPPGKSYVKQHGHMVAFGVPKGALIDGKPSPHANVFVAQWRVLGRVLERKPNRLEKTYFDAVLFARTQAVEWVQFRLNDREDELEILQPVRVLRQKGHEKGEAFCSAKEAAWMNQSFCPPVPVNREASEWAECNHFDKGRVAALKFRFDPRSRLYEWVELGPFLSEAKTSFSEASLLHTSKEWILATRTNRGIGWTKSADPFVRWEKTTFAREPVVSAPLTAFQCPDGLVRLFTGDRAASPQRYDRDPLYCWDVHPERDFAVTNRQTLFDSQQAKLGMRPAVRAKIDFCELFPHHGKTQLIVHGVSTRAYDFPYEGVGGIPILNAEEKAASGLYFSRITYRKEQPPAWTFGR